LVKETFSTYVLLSNAKKPMKIVKREEGGGKRKKLLLVRRGRRSHHPYRPLHILKNFQRMHSLYLIAPLRSSQRG
jgi:hypothetical protein